MASVISWIFGESPDETESINDCRNTQPAIDGLNQYLDTFNISVERKSDTTLVFKRRNEKEFFTLSVVPRWDAEHKDVYAEWYINELFYPQRRKLSEFVEWLNKIGIDMEICTYTISNSSNVLESKVGREMYFLKCVSSEENLPINIFINTNYTLIVDYKSPIVKLFGKE